MQLDNSRVLLAKMISEPGSDADMLLACLRDPSNNKLDALLSNLSAITHEQRFIYLDSFLKLSNGDIGAAINSVASYSNDGPTDLYAQYNLGKLLEAAYDLTKAEPLLQLALQAYSKAWKADSGFKPASDALRDIFRDRFKTAEMLIDKLGKKPRAVIEPTTYCHLKCRGCTRTIEDTPSIHMPLATFKKVIDNMPPVSDIVLHGLGEPTLNRELPDMIRYAIGSGKTGIVSFSTTGLNKDFSIYQKCFDSGLTYLRVSVDSLDPEVAEICRKGTNIELLEENIRAFVAARFPIEIVTVVSKLNLEDLEKTLWRLDTLGHFKVRGLMYLDKGEDAGNLDAAGAAQAQLIFQEMREKVHNIEITHLNDYATAVEYGVCGSITDITVDVGGYLSPCCHVYDRGIYDFLSLAEHSYEEIRQSMLMHDFIRRYVDQAPDFCGGCLMNNRPTNKMSYPSQRQFDDSGRPPPLPLLPASA